MLTPAKLAWADGHESLFDIEPTDTLILQKDTAGTRHWFHVTGHVDNEGHEMFAERQPNQTDRVYAGLHAYGFSPTDTERRRF
jgi:hypothetical protein